MFGKKKNDDLTDQLATYQERGAPRWGAPQFDLDAAITLEGYEGEGQLGNVSVTGCSLKSVTYVQIIPNNVYQAKIFPGKEDNINPFNLKLRLSWTKSNETVFHAGFSLEGDEGKAQLQSYVNKLRSRGIPPDYGNMKK